MTIRDDGEVRLCPVTAGEADLYASWMKRGQWRAFDAPWENLGERWASGELARFREGFLATASRQGQAVSKCTVYLGDDPIGWVSSYRLSPDGSSVKVGIDICVDSYLGRGLGTRSLCLWTEYWFEERKLHRVGLDTWSLNARMIRVAAKCGFVAEGVEREVVWWDGAWQSLHHFGMTAADYTRWSRERRADGLKECS